MTDPRSGPDPYLSRHAEREARAVDGLSGSFGHVLVIPAYGEGRSLLDALGSVPRGPEGDTLLVVVLNARADSPPSVHEANAATRERLTALSTGGTPPRVISDSPPITAVPLPHGQLVLIDRAAPGHFLPEGQGVGLARKIGNDFALALHHAGRVASLWIHNTDADVRLPNDYFDQIGPVGGEIEGVVYFYEHRFSEDADLAEAARLYEISLRYYTLGLAWAGSPYAYEAMGSCIAVRPAAYAAVRGFPKKNAAEDFYFLNKLAKVGPIARLAGSPLLLEGRISERVPFGTGRALKDMTAHGRGRSGFRGFSLYHPMVFAHLSAWLSVLERTAASGGRVDLAVDELPRENPFFQTGLLVETLEKMGAFAAVREAIEKSSGDPATMLRHFHAWFDAFRTRKLIHALRDKGLRSPGYIEALAEAPFTGLSASTEDDTEFLRQALAAEERKLADSPAGWSARGGT